MSPLRDTMRLIYSIKRYFHRAQEIDILFFRQTFWSHIQELRPSRTNIFLGAIYLALCQRRVDEVCNTVVLTHHANGIHLILHECDKRRDDDGRSLHQ